MSVCTTAISAMNKVVMEPMTMTKDSAVSDNSNSGDMRETMKMPAVTMVAAWISAEIGVGPSMESGSQTCSGTWADLPMAPTNSERQMTVSSDQAAPGRISTAVSANCGAAANTVA